MVGFKMFEYLHPKEMWIYAFDEAEHSVDRADGFQEVRVLSLVANILGILSRIQMWVWCNLSVGISSKNQAKRMLWKMLLFTFVAGWMMYNCLYFFFSHSAFTASEIGGWDAQRLWKKQHVPPFLFREGLICFIVHMLLCFHMASICSGFISYSATIHPIFLVLSCINISWNSEL